LDPQGTATSALLGLVRNYGWTAAIEDQALLKANLENLLSEEPRERNLILWAASSTHLAKELQDLIGQGMSVDLAVQLAATQLASNEPYDLASCFWVTNAFAQAIASEVASAAPTVSQRSRRPRFWNRRKVSKTDGGSGEPWLLDLREVLKAEIRAAKRRLKAGKIHPDEYLDRYTRKGRLVRPTIDDGLWEIRTYEFEQWELRMFGWVPSTEPGTGHTYLLWNQKLLDRGPPSLEWATAQSLIGLRTFVADATEDRHQGPYSPMEARDEDLVELIKGVNRLGR